MGRDDGMRVVVSTISGISGDAVDKVRGDLAGAGAVDGGVVQLADAWNQTDTGARSRLATALNLPDASFARMRTEAADRVANEFAANNAGTLLALVDAGLVGEPSAAFGASEPGEARVWPVGAAPHSKCAAPSARARTGQASRRGSW